jgi:hypothetical protein
MKHTFNGSCRGGPLEGQSLEDHQNVWRIFEPPSACEHRDQTSNRIKRNWLTTSELFKPPLYSLSGQSRNIQMR